MRNKTVYCRCSNCRCSWASNILGGPWSDNMDYAWHLIRPYDICPAIRYLLSDDVTYDQIDWSCLYTPTADMQAVTICFRALTQITLIEFSPDFQLDQVTVFILLNTPGGITIHKGGGVEKYLFFPKKNKKQFSFPFFELLTPKTIFWPPKPSFGVNLCQKNT